MTGTPATLADLLSEYDDHGIRLLIAGDDGLTIDAPEDALTPDLLARLKAHKTELLSLLGATAPWLRDEWVLRPNASGRMGIERAGLSDDQRWWASGNCWFDDESQPTDNSHGLAK
jgi:TubC N-terminal docking domain